VGEAKTVPLTITGCVQWDSKFCINSTLINMMIDANGRLMPIPVNKLVYKVSDVTGKPATILGVHRIQTYILNNKSGVQGLYDYSSRYLLFHSTVTNEMSQTYCMTQVYIDENSPANLLGWTPILNNSAAGTTLPNLGLNFANRPKFSFASNASNQCIFVDDNKTPFTLYYSDIEPYPYHPESLDWKNAKARRDDVTLPLITNYAGQSGVQATSNDGTILYNQLLNSGAVTLVENLMGYGVLYNSNQNVIVFTELNAFDRILWLTGKMPQYTDASTPTNYTLTKPGIPVCFKLPCKVVSMHAINGALFVFSDEAILKYNLSIVNNDPVLNLDLNFYFKFKSRFGGSSIVYQNILFFTTQDDKLYSINPAGKINEYTERILPDKYFFQYNTYTDSSGGTQTYYPNRDLNPVKFLGVDGLVVNNLILNLKNGTFSHLISKENLTYSAPNGTKFDIPKRITASTEDGRLVALQDKLLSVAFDYDRAVYYNSDNPDFFAPGIYITSQHIFAKEGRGTLCAANIVLNDSAIDPSLLNSFVSFKLGMYILSDRSYDDGLIKNLRNDEWWADKQITFSRHQSTNVFRASMGNLTCQNFILCFRFSKLTVTTSGAAQEYEIQKAMINSISVNIIE